jgi:hypothetical protein
VLPLLIFAQLSATDALLAKARTARYQQDSTLAEYTAIARQRMSSGIGLSTVFGVGIPGPERLAARFESVARVGWHHAKGPWGEVIGSRGIAPFVGQTEPDADDEIPLVLPYYPGTDALWPMTELRGAFHDHHDWITHPFAPGSDSLYEFSLGDSVGIRLASGERLTLREIRMRPRRPSERLVVGSLWVDAATGALVRAAYRPSTSVDLWPLMSADMDDNDNEAARKFGPYTGTVREVIIEDGLYDGRFWLPRIRIASGEGTAHGIRVTISIEQTFTYEGVRGVPAGQRVVIDSTPADRDSTGRVRYAEWNGRVTSGPCRAAGDTSTSFAGDSLATSDKLRVVHSQGIRFRMIAPCNDSAAVHSPMLPGSIFDKGEALFAEADFNRLRRDVAGALSIDRQADWKPQPTKISYGWQGGLLRYNRIEGLAPAVRAERELGKGYTSSYLARVGLADGIPTAEAAITRTNIERTWHATVYRRLSVANTWGDPLGIGASAVALLFGRDDGLYFHSIGLEAGSVERPSAGNFAIGWTAYAQREDAADPKTNFSFGRVFRGTDFAPNISATAGFMQGLSTIVTDAWGDDPRATRLTSTLRGDAFSYPHQFGGRGSVELGLTQGVGRTGTISLTGSAGTGSGLVTQRLWYLGGPATVRGFAPGALVGEAFWFGRAEIGRGPPLFRPTLFGDIGWAGAQRDISQSSGTISGVGVGVGIMEGLLRLDVARASTGKFRADFYFNPR